MMLRPASIDEWRSVNYPVNRRIAKIDTAGSVFARNNVHSINHAMTTDVRLDS
jgi:hypothetical protein